MIKLENGDFVNSDDVCFIRGAARCKINRAPRSTLTLRKGAAPDGHREYIALGDPFEIACRVNSTITKSDPGYVLLTVYGGDEFAFSQETIIAWKIGMGSSDLPMPITVSDWDEDLGTLTILCVASTLVLMSSRTALLLFAVSTSFRAALAASSDAQMVASFASCALSCALIAALCARRARRHAIGEYLRRGVAERLPGQRVEIHVLPPRTVRS
jgi:hypothetical protein